VSSAATDDARGACWRVVVDFLRLPGVGGQTHSAADSAPVRSVSQARNTQGRST